MGTFAGGPRWEPVRPTSLLLVLRTLRDLFRGRRVAEGARDSPRANVARPHGLGHIAVGVAGRRSVFAVDPGACKRYGGSMCFAGLGWSDPRGTAQVRRDAVLLSCGRSVTILQQPSFHMTFVIPASQSAGANVSAGWGTARVKNPSATACRRLNWSPRIGRYVFGK
jgi:hypothetical protein